MLGRLAQACPVRGSPGLTEPNDDMPDWQLVFLDNLRATGNVSEAARSVGRRRSAVYALRRADPSFASLWEEALEDAADRLEREALRRAVEGTHEDRFFQGQAVGGITRYSDSLLMFLLRARRPGLFDPHFRGRMPVLSEDDDRIKAQLDRKMEKFADAFATGRTQPPADESEPG